MSLSIFSSFGPVKRVCLLVLCILQIFRTDAAPFRNASFGTVDFDCYKWPRERYPAWGCVTFLYGQTEQCYDQFGDSAPLFAGVGSATFGQMAAHYPYLKDYPQTKAFIEDVSVNPAYSFAERNGLVATSKLELLEASLLFGQGFASDFNFTLELPLRSIHIAPIKFVSKGKGDSPFAQLVNDRINPVLDEHKIERLDKAITDVGFGDATVSLGWSNKFYNDYQKLMVTAIGGAIKGGIILPTSTISGFNKNYLYTIPLGNNGSFGVRVQVDAEIEFSPYAVLTAMFDSKVFLNKTETLRVCPDLKMQGIALTPRAFVTFDNGHEWRVGGAFKTGSQELGLFASCGYSFSNKEISAVRLTDTEKANLQAIEVFDDADTLTLSELGTRAKRKVNFSDYLINNDRNFATQQVHTLHLALQFSPKQTSKTDASSGEAQPAGTPQPIIEIAFHWPIYAKNYLFLPQFTGRVGFGFQLHF